MNGINSTWNRGNLSYIIFNKYLLLWQNKQLLYMLSMRGLTQIIVGLVLLIMNIYLS